MHQYAREECNVFITFQAMNLAIVGFGRLKSLYQLCMAHCTKKSTRLRPGAMSTTNPLDPSSSCEIDPHKSTSLKFEFPIAKYSRDNLPTCSDFDSYPTPESAIDQSQRENPTLWLVGQWWKPLNFKEMPLFHIGCSKITIHAQCASLIHILSYIIPNPQSSSIINHPSSPSFSAQQISQF